MDSYAEIKLVEAVKHLTEDELDDIILLQYIVIHPGYESKEYKMGQVIHRNRPEFQPTNDPRVEHIIFSRRWSELTADEKSNIKTEITDARRLTPEICVKYKMSRQVINKALSRSRWRFPCF
jgi:hypothetical protein